MFGKLVDSLCVEVFNEFSNCVIDLFFFLVRDFLFGHELCWSRKTINNTNKIKHGNDCMKLKTWMRMVKDRNVEALIKFSHLQMLHEKASTKLT